MRRAPDPRFGHDAALIRTCWRPTVREHQSAKSAGMKMLYLDDLRPGEVMESPTFSIDHDEMVEFARRWDPVPIHMDPEAAAGVGGITASGTYVLAVKSRLLHELPAAV